MGDQERGRPPRAGAHRDRGHGEPPLARGARRSASVTIRGMVDEHRHAGGRPDVVHAVERGVELLGQDHRATPAAPSGEGQADQQQPDPVRARPARSGSERGLHHPEAARPSAAAPCSRRCGPRRALEQRAEHLAASSRSRGPAPGTPARAAACSPRAAGRWRSRRGGAPPRPGGRLSSASTDAQDLPHSPGRGIDGGDRRHVGLAAFGRGCGELALQVGDLRPGPDHVRVLVAVARGELGELEPEPRPAAARRAPGPAGTPGTVSGPPSCDLARAASRCASRGYVVAVDPELGVEPLERGEVDVDLLGQLARVAAS